MGKPNGRKRAFADHKSGNASSKSMKHPDRSSRSFDEDTTMFINMSQDLKEEGSKLYHKRDYEGAILKYEKALKLLPRNHIDIALLRSYMAGCYMHIGLGEYPQAINECNLALEVSPRYSKALVKRAKCYGELNRLDLALRDVNTVLSVEPNNLAALEILENLRKTVEDKGMKFDEEKLNAALAPGSRLRKVVREKLRKKKGKKNETDKAEDKVVVEENVAKTVDKAEMLVEPVKEDKGITRTAKLVYGDDIRWVQLPVNCRMKLVRDIIRDRFPGLKGFLVKYKDQDGDLVTITTTDELRLAESSGQVPGSVRFHITEVDPHHQPSYEEEKMKVDGIENNGATEEDEDASSRVTSVEDWIIQFARLFKNRVGFDSDSYLDLHELGMTLYSEAMEDTVTSDDAQDLFEIAADKFQEMSALAMFNWGNVHMCKARKQASFPEEGPRESALEHLRAAYEWAQKEYMRAEMKYEEALKIKPDFFEGYLALGHQRFEQAKLCWYYANACKMDLEAGPADQVIELYNKAEDSMEKGIFMLEQIEEQRLNGISKSEKHKARLNKMGLDGLLNDVSFVDAAEQCRSMTSQINLLWGTLLYERSVVEYKLHLPTWEECLEVSVEKFELAGVCQTDIAVMIKNHCSNVKSSEGWGFKIDELVQAWNEMYDAQRWQFGTPSFRLEPLFRRRAPKLHEMLEQF